MSRTAMYALGRRLAVRLSCSGERWTVAEVGRFEVRVRRAGSALLRDSVYVMRTPEGRLIVRAGPSPRYLFEATDDEHGFDAIADAVRGEPPSKHGFDFELRSRRPY